MKITIKKLEKEMKRNDRKIDKLEKRNDRLHDIIEKMRFENTPFRKGDIIVGKAKCFNKVSEVVARIERIDLETTDWATGKRELVVDAYTPRQRKYEFKVREIEKASTEQVAEYNKKQNKYYGR